MVIFNIIYNSNEDVEFNPKNNDDLNDEKKVGENIIEIENIQNENVWYLFLNFKLCLNNFYERKNFKTV